MDSMTLFFALLAVSGPYLSRDAMVSVQAMTSPTPGNPGYESTSPDTTVEENTESTSAETTTTPTNTSSWSNGTESSGNETITAATTVAENATLWSNDTESLSNGTTITPSPVETNTSYWNNGTESSGNETITRTTPVAANATSWSNGTESLSNQTSTISTSVQTTTTSWNNGTESSVNETITTRTTAQASSGSSSNDSQSSGNGTTATTATAQASTGSSSNDSQSSGTGTTATTATTQASTASSSNDPQSSSYGTTTTTATVEASVASSSNDSQSSGNGTTTTPATVAASTASSSNDSQSSGNATTTTTATVTTETNKASGDGTTTIQATTQQRGLDTADALFAYGYGEGDWALFGDDRLYYVYISRGFPTDSTKEHYLYISTNGYIVFGRYYNSFIPRKLPYRDLKIVAPFWTDSTTYYFTRYYYYWYYWNYSYYHLGSRVYFQTYYNGKKRYGEDASELFNRVNEFISRKKNVKPFKARWILKVTWYNMLQAYQTETNTFQCILATDYQRSFTIFLYDNGNMNWPTTSYSYAPGIGYQMGKKVYESPYSRRLEAMRIDSITGNTGKKGQYVFQLDDNRAGVSPALQCLAWHESQSASDAQVIRNLDNTLSDCPCTIWDAFFDSRFRFVWWEREYYEGNYCFYHWLGTGSRKCCYRLWRIRWQYSWGWWFRYFWTFNTDIVTGGGLTLNNPFWRYRQYLDRDRAAYLNCCVLSGQCDLYRDYRWLSDCSRYVRPRVARFWGDPHLTTLDGIGYTFNGWGEYVLLDVTNSVGGGVKLKFQGRTDRVRNEAGEMTDATVFTAFAVKDYDTNSTMEALLNGNKTDMNVFCNGVDYTERFQNRLTDFNIGNGELGCSRPENNTLAVSFSSGISMNVTIGTELLEIAVTIPADLASNINTKGLLGVFNSDKTDDFTCRNGTRISINSTESEIFQFGQTWLINDADSIFRYRPGDNASNHRHEEFTPKFLSDYPQDRVDEATQTCEGNNECIYDYLSTNRTDIALSTRNTSSTSSKANDILGNNIPTLSLDRTTIQATVGEESRIQITASDADNETVTIYLVNNITGVNTITQTGNTAIFAWTPNSLDPVNIGISGSDPNGGEAPSQSTRVLLCSGCSNHGQCDFNDTAASLVETSSNGTTFTVVSCDCEDGWIGDACDQDYDGCSDDPCPQGTDCTDVTPDVQLAQNGTAYSCGDCPTGFEKVQSKCLDIDECNVTENVCDQLCFNTDGSYNCACEDGYHLEGTSTCLDNDECERGVDSCSQKCTNVPGSYNCSCETGYISNDDGRNCTVDPNNDPCSGSKLNCEYGCRQGTNGAECFCQSGYTLSGTTSCVDIDECEQGLCQQSCTNLDGSFTCNCYTGYKQSSDKITCEKCDPLHFGPNCDNLCECNENAVECHHTRGCVCKTGWEGADCDTDVDECDTIECGYLQKCVNSPGTYDCVCMDGYKNDSGKCTDIDECADVLLHNCTYDCANVQGSFLCKCAKGYTGDGFACNDVDECATQVTDCQHKCVNTDGSYGCDCYQGFELDDDRKSCTDVDKLCGVDSGGCNQICSINETTSQIQCFCSPGYELVNDKHCGDIDECSNNVCSQTCENTLGKFTCTCKLGYSLANDGTTCEECDAFHWGVNCQTDCNCGPGSTCNNTVGCICAEGWTGVRCDTDIQECQDPNKCDQTSLCVELLGSYRCDCPVGKERINNAGLCVDIDECTRDTHDCAHNCINTDGSYTCICNPGYISPQGDGKICDDIDECALGHLCEALCTNTDGGSTCSCHQGFNLNTDKLTCKRTANEPCGVRKLSCEYGCNSTSGECFCANENKLQSDGISCRLVRYRVKAQISLQLTFTADLTKTHTDSYKIMVHNIQEALRSLYKDIPNFSTVLVLELINGSVSAVHEAVFTTQVSLTQTQGVTTALSTAYSSGATVTVGGVTVAITSVPVLITVNNTQFLVNQALTCAAAPCAYNEVCNEGTGVAKCYPEGTTFAVPATEYYHGLAIGLGVGIPLAVLLVVIIILVVVKPWAKSSGSGKRSDSPTDNQTPTGSRSALLGKRGSRVSPSPDN